MIQLSRKKSLVLLWVESSHTLSHLERYAGIMQALRKRGIDVALLTSKQCLQKAVDSAGSLEAFGIPEDVIKFPLPPDKETAGTFPPFKEDEYALWQFMKDPDIVARRKEAIKKAVAQLSENYNVTHIITEHWPCGFGMFTDENIYIKDAVKAKHPHAKMCGLVREIPVFIDGSEFNDRHKQIEIMRKHCDKLYVHGEKDVFEGYYEDKGIDRGIRDKIVNLGHIAYPGVPERKEDAPEKRKVLVSGGGAFADPDAYPKEKNDYYKYYMAIIQSKPYTALKDRDWVVYVPPACPKAWFEEFSEAAKSVKNVEVRRNVSISEHRTAVANCAANITVAGYGGTMAGILADVPTVVVPACYEDPAFQLDMFEHSRMFEERQLVTMIGMKDINACMTEDINRKEAALKRIAGFIDKALIQTESRDKKEDILIDLHGIETLTERIWADTHHQRKNQQTNAGNIKTR